MTYDKYIITKQDVETITILLKEYRNINNIMLSGRTLVCKTDEDRDHAIKRAKDLSETIRTLEISIE